MSEHSGSEHPGPEHPGPAHPRPVHHGPVELVLVRHGQSTGNVASASADRAGLPRIDIDLRDADVPLSPTGEDQARALGRWLRDLPDDETPQAVWSSPFVRAQDTARLALTEAGIGLPLRLDERLRDRDLGVLDRLSLAGIREEFPDEAERRQWHGKFYYRPPGGESWTDVALRVRTFLADLDRLGPTSPRRILITCHDAVIMVFRYVCEGMSEHEVLELGRTRGVANASVTRLRREEGGDPFAWTADLVSAEDHLTDHGAAHTDQKGATDVA